MRVLLLGGTGLIGGQLATVLRDAGHELVLGVRGNGGGSGATKVFPDAATVQVDFSRDHHVDDWLPRLAGIDAVVNAVGIISEQRGQRFDAIHTRAPIALFEACAWARVKRVIQISAVGADEGAESGYHRSKRAADQALLASDLSAVVVQPSLVFAPSGASTRLFGSLAALPVVPLPGRGRQCVQPVHLDDLCALLLACIEHPDPPRRVVAAGPRPLEFREYLACLRRLMSLEPTWFLPVPMALARLGVRLAGALPGPGVDPETLDMLQRGACADPGGMERLTGRPPRPPEQFTAPGGLHAFGLAARLDWLLPMMRLALAAMWIATGLVSLGIYPVHDSLALLARTGLHGGFALFALYSAALLDLAFGVATLALRRRAWLYRAQFLLIAGYTVIISIHLPEFWLHPYGPILKNLPVLALIVALHELERGKKWTT